MTNLKINTNKPFLIFSTSRAGTTILLSIIKNYSKERFTLSEVFNFDYTIIDNNIKLDSIETQFLVNNPDAEIKNRIQLLKKYEDKNIPIKIHSNQMTNDIFDYVKDKYLIVLMERTDKYDQLLSWLIAVHTNIWNVSTNDIIEQPIEFTVDLDIIDRFFEKHQLYQKWKMKFLKNSDIINVYYNDLTPEDNYKKITEKMGILYDNRKLQYSYKKLYTLIEKEKIIINLDEIKEYIKGRL